MKTIHKKPGDVIVREGEETSEAYIILSGVIEVTKKGKSIALLKENSIFGEIALVDQRPRTATCTAKTAVALGMVTRENYRELIKYRPQAVIPILKIVTDRMRNLMTIMGDMSDMLGGK
jgi:CRP-like cAMP-binding protein